MQTNCIEERNKHDHYEQQEEIRPQFKKTQSKSSNKNVREKKNTLER